MFCHIESDDYNSTAKVVAGRGLLKLLYLAPIRMLKDYPHEFLVCLRLRSGIGAPVLW
jgi:hypothetical protein